MEGLASFFALGWVGGVRVGAWEETGREGTGGGVEAGGSEEALDWERERWRRSESMEVLARTVPVVVLVVLVGSEGVLDVEVLEGVSRAGSL